jgi:N-acetylglucosaminyl-diphospho-decaprenol L-rhamnosyltransferase
MNTASQSAQPHLSVIIVSYNCKDLLAEAIRSVGQFVTGSHEIVVVDNASSDGTRETIPQLFPEVIFIANTTNAGFSKANNQGFSVSRGRFILLLNPDAKLVDGRISAALDYLEKHPQTMIGPKLLNPDLSLQESAFPYPSFLDVLLETFFLTYVFRARQQQILKKGEYALSGACILVPRTIYESLGGLDNDLFWMDDVDFCFRALKAGIAVHYFAGWSVIHVIGESGRKNYKVSISNQLVSKLKFFKKHKQPLNLVCSAILIQVHILLRLLLFLLLSPFKPVYRLKLSAYWHTQAIFFNYIFTDKKQTF